YIKPDENPEKGEKYVGEYRFRNSSWELHLLFEKSGTDYFVSKNSTIRNVHPSGRLQYGSRKLPKVGSSGKKETKPLQFLLKQSAGDGLKRFTLDVSTEDLPSGAVAKFKVAQKIDTELDPTKLFDVDQVFEW